MTEEKWPRIVELARHDGGKTLCEAHAPWCPVELAREMHAGSAPMFFVAGMTPNCRCADNIINQPTLAQPMEIV